MLPAELGDQSAIHQSRLLGIFGVKAIPHRITGIGEVVVAAKPKLFGSRDRTRDGVGSSPRSGISMAICGFRQRGSRGPADAGVVVVEKVSSNYC